MHVTQTITVFLFINSSKSTPGPRDNRKSPAIHSFVFLQSYMSSADVVRVLYRNLIRLGRRYDNSPSLKFIFRSLTFNRFPLSKKNNAFANFSLHVHNFIGFDYIPEKSLTDHIRRSFRVNVSGAKCGEALDTAFLAIR